jgi:hypothetical protein
VGFGPPIGHRIKGGNITDIITDIIANIIANIIAHIMQPASHG